MFEESPRRGALLLLLASCASSELTEPVVERDVVEVKQIPVGQVPQLDVLLVLDDSPRSEANRANLEGMLPDLAEVLASRTIDGWVPVDLHLGVITTDAGCGGDDVGDDGDLQSVRHLVGQDPAGAPVDLGTEACAMLGGDAFITNTGAPDGSRVTNVEGSLADAIACLASVGVDGCEFDQPLEAMRRALTKAKDGTGNHGFLRDDALLMVVIVTDADDCSAGSPALFSDDDEVLGLRDAFRCFEYGVRCDQPARDPDIDEGPAPAVAMTNCVPDQALDGPVAPIERYVDFLHGLKDQPRRVMVVTVVGPRYEVAVGRQSAGDPAPGWYTLDHACVAGDEFGGEGGDLATSAAATPAVRLDAFRQAFPDRNLALRFCRPDLADSLRSWFTGLGPVLTHACFSSMPVDIEPATPGLQPECTVSIHHEDGSAARLLPACDEAISYLPCWRLAPDEGCGNRDTGDLALYLEWGGAVPIHQLVDVQCVVTGA
jgi:hypothetical protein